MIGGYSSDSVTRRWPTPPATGGPNWRKAMTQTLSKVRIAPRSRALVASLSVGASSLLLATGLAQAHDNKVQIQDSGSQRCIISNGLPDHMPRGRFPTGATRTAFLRKMSGCVLPNRRKRAHGAKQVRGSIGVALEWGSDPPRNSRLV